MAFKLVVILDLKRRENNAKVLAVKVQMQSMMSVLFQLRDVKDPESLGPDGLTLPGRLQALMDDIATNIKECASACDLYMKKSLIRKYLKSFIYEARLADYATQFSEYESEIQRALTTHTALGVDAANEKLDEQAARLHDMQSQMKQLLLRLDTPQEKEIRDMIGLGGGAMACITDNQMLRTLIDKSGEDISNLAGRLEIDLGDMRQSLLKELAEDVDTALKRNLALFEGKLDIQKREIEDTITRQGDRIIAYLSGGHERIIDPQIREIWKEMGWKSTVKARHFVLALRDYFLNGKGTNANSASPGLLSSPPILSPPVTSPFEQSDYDFTNSQHCSNDEWAQTYVNVSYLQAISESIDDDGSGFINIQEINAFTTMRPKGWSLLQWLAYWAEGWHSSISIYSTKIYRVLRKIYKLRQKVRPDNLRALDAHLDKLKLYRLELLLRSTKSVPDGTIILPELAKLRDEFVAQEEKKFQENLEKISYTIDSIATVSLLTGPGRIERAVQLGRTHILHTDEFEASYESLVYVFSSFDTRLQDLSAIFRQMHINPEHQFENYAYGMVSTNTPRHGRYHFLTESQFKSSYGFIPWVVSGHSFVPVWEKLPSEPGEDDDVITCPDDISLDILKFGPQDPLSYPTLIPFTPTEQVDDGPRILQGSWAGYTMWLRERTLTPHEGLFRLNLADEVGENGMISGTANGYMGPLELTGCLTTVDEDSKRKHLVDVVMAYNDGYWIRCTGVLDTSSGTITGDWYSLDFSGEPKPLLGSKVDDRRDGGFQFSRTPAPLVRFRYTQDEFEDSRAQARWKFACSAVLYQVQRDRLSKDYVISHLRNGRRFKELVIKRVIEASGSTRRSLFTDDERQELRELESTVCPTVDQLYYSIARYVFERLTYHFGVICDGPECGRKILQSRLLCIVCIDQTLTNSLDFCVECQDVELPHHASHNSSHSLLRGDRFLHDCERAWMIPAARTLSERVKNTFQERALASSDNKNDLKEHDGRERDCSSNENITCVFCKNDISLPCWVCLECPGDSFVCDNCDKKHQLPPLPEKMVTTPASMIHAMLRIKDDKPVEIPDDDQLVRVEKRLTGVKTNVEERLDNLEKHLITRTAALESILTSHLQSGSTANIQNESEQEHSPGFIERRLEALEARFTSLEKLLHDFLNRATSTTA
ncbi:hypothetical protein H0H87_011401 [Tephrocybe sp. NHM501043]|nr:hypothetical protein H0H87_011401 [Tephrocybe sp. NHM501043]